MRPRTPCQSARTPAFHTVELSRNVSSINNRYLIPPHRISARLSHRRHREVGPSPLIRSTSGSLRPLPARRLPHVQCRTHWGNYSLKVSEGGNAEVGALAGHYISNESELTTNQDAATPANIGMDTLAGNIFETTVFGRFVIRLSGLRSAQARTKPIGVSASPLLNFPTPPKNPLCAELAGPSDVSLSPP